MEKSAKLGLAGDFSSLVWSWRKSADISVAVDKSVCDLRKEFFCANIYSNQSGLIFENMDASLYLSDSLAAKLGIVGLLIFVGFFILWVSAIVSIIRNKQIASAGQKVGWILLNLFTVIIGSMIYFFRFRFLKRAWTTAGLVVAFVVLIAVYAFVQSASLPYSAGEDPWASCPAGQECGVNAGDVNN